MCATVHGGKNVRSIGIICEYNPFHKGHQRQLRLARELAGEDCALVCLMSGNYVQRGEPAIFPKMLRAEAALRCGADLVLELPLTAALSSAEGFAAGGVSILTALGCDALCFGTESDDCNLIMSTAKANLDPAFDALLRAELSTGRSYPAARQRVIDTLVGADAHIGPSSETQPAPNAVGADAHIGPPSEDQPAPNAVGADAHIGPPSEDRPASNAVGADAHIGPSSETQPAPNAVGADAHIGPPSEDQPAPNAVGADAHIGPPSENHQPSILSNPNDILAVEYCKAILKQGSPVKPLPIRRTGAYHAEALDPEAPSATALRAVLRSACRGGHWPPAQGDVCQSCHCEASAHTGRGNPSPDWRCAVPEQLHDLYTSAPIHTMQAGERAVLGILRTLPEAAFRALPFGSEGLWSKFMKNCRSCASVNEIIDATKSKRYTRTRIQRMLLCAFLGLTAADLERQPPYVRVLGFTDRGRAALREMKKRLEARGSQSGDGSLIELVNAGQTPPDPAWLALETRAADLYSLFSEAGPRPAGEEDRLRVCVIP